MSIAAIPTNYKGVQMRSRLEAKWAAFFDLCEIPWQYEPIDMPGYIPDFQTIISGIPCLVEVKPLRFDAPIPQEAISKMERGISSGQDKWASMIVGLDYTVVWAFTETGWKLVPEQFAGRNSQWLAASNSVQWRASLGPKLGPQLFGRRGPGGAIVHVENKSNVSEPAPVNASAFWFRVENFCYGDKCVKADIGFYPMLHVPNWFDSISSKIKWVKVRENEIVDVCYTDECREPHLIGRRP